MICDMLVSVMMLFSSVTGGSSVSQSAADDYLKAIRSTDFCAHALGGIDGYSYTNSKEALEQSYKKGARIFEADIHLTSDGEAVLVHGWRKNDYLYRIGENNYPKANKADGSDYVPAYDEFMGFSIMGRYTPMDMKMLADFMREHGDMFVMVDIASEDYEGTVRAYKAIVRACGGDDSVLSHLITGGHTKDMIAAVKSVYDFKLYNLYYSDEILSDDLDTDDFISYCRSEGIQSFSCAEAMYTDEAAKKLKEGGLISFVYTINDEDKADRIIAMGADIVGSDHIQRY